AVDQPAAVGRERGAERAAVARRARVHVAGLAVVRAHDVLRELRVVVPVARAGALREPDPAAVRPERRADALAPVLAADELDARAAVHVEQLERWLVRAAEIAHGRDDVLAVRRPLRRLRAVRLALR